MSQSVGGKELARAFETAFCLLAIGEFSLTASLIAALDRTLSPSTPPHPVIITAHSYEAEVSAAFVGGGVGAVCL